MIKLIHNKQEIKYEKTVFPDKTTQVWKLESTEFLNYELVEIQWFYENDSEIFEILQLGRLVRKYHSGMMWLYAPYLPYGRQDKSISNTQTFARKVLLDILVRYGPFKFIRTFDAHSKDEAIYSISPANFFSTIFNHDIVCFPDAGAKERYAKCFMDFTQFIIAEKKRNQQTGVIEGYTLDTKGLDLNGKRILVVDDICDGGGTFVALASELRSHNVAQLDLAVSHGIFSKGKQILFDAGYSNLFTTNSLLTNAEGFNVL